MAERLAFRTGSSWQDLCTLALRMSRIETSSRIPHRIRPLHSETNFNFKFIEPYKHDMYCGLSTTVWCILQEWCDGKRHSGGQHRCCCAGVH